MDYKCIICLESIYFTIRCFNCRNILCDDCLEMDRKGCIFAVKATNSIIKCEKENYGYCPYKYDDFNKWRNNWAWLFVTWFCTEKCMINFIINKCENDKKNYFELESKPDGVKELCNRQHNIWLKMVIDDQDILISDLLKIVYEYAQK